MQRRRALVGMLVISMLTAALGAFAAEYQSSFGFRISVSDAWLVLSRPELAKNAELFLDDGGSPGLEAVPRSMRRAIYDRVQAGELEIFYRREGAAGLFVDNVNVLMQPADLPMTPEQLVEVCLVLPREFSRVFGRPIAMDTCEVRKRMNRRTLYLQFEGAIRGTTTLQYQIQRGRGLTLVVTGTSSTENLPRMMGEFEEMIASIRLH
jgi:hypothetical protein